MKTYSIKPGDITRKWYLLDAADLPLGRLATHIAVLLTGKYKAQFSHHIDCGDYVIVVNAKNLKVTGNKLKDKKYYRHSSYPGGLSEATLEEKMQKDPSEVIYHAVRGMLPVNKLRPMRLQRLKIYADNEHAHEAQKPEHLKLRKDKNV